MQHVAFTNDVREQVLLTNIIAEKPAYSIIKLAKCRYSYHKGYRTSFKRFVQYDSNNILSKRNFKLITQRTSVVNRSYKK